MAKADKTASIAELTESFRTSNAAVLTEYRGLTVKQLTTLRTSIREHATYTVVKNTLTRRAAAEAGVSALDGQLTGPSAIAFVTGDPVETAKVLREFAKANPLLVIKGGVLDGRAMTADDIRKLRRPRVARGASRQARRGHAGLAEQGGLPLRRSALAGSPRRRTRCARRWRSGRARPLRPQRLRPRHPPRTRPTPRSQPRLPPTTSPRVATRRADLLRRPTRHHHRYATHGKEQEGTPSWRSSAPTSSFEAFKGDDPDRALRVRQAVRGDLRRHRRRSGGRRRRCRPGRRRGRGCRGAGRVRRHPRGRRREEDRRHQGEVRALTSLGLKEAKDLVDGAPRPSSRRSTRPRPRRPRAARERGATVSLK